MDRESFKNWLAAYGNAWTRRDPEAAASLYADNATYQVTPFDEPLRGRAAIYEYWADVAKTEEKIQFDYEIRQVAGVLCPRTAWPVDETRWNLSNRVGFSGTLPVPSRVVA